MKAYVEPPESPSWSLLRIRNALVRFALPSVEIVRNRDDAELVVLHVNGRRDRNQAIAEQLLKRGQRYAVVQYCVRSTQKPYTGSWSKLWTKADLVWSYLDIPAFIAEDGADMALFNFYHSPLGIEDEFRATIWPTKPRKYLIGTSGLSWLTEGVKEAANAAWRVNGKVFHLGPTVSRDPRIVCLQGMNDIRLGGFWASCNYVSGLRRTEGFELPAVEGLACGARPILYDQHHYKIWYEDLAEYIPEGSRPEVTDALEAIFRNTWRAVTKAERVEAQRRFDWFQIIKGFWERCGA